ncbi:MAG: type II toxin-antitoxin system RelE/ParE family toxin [Burkholderiales bacterium]|nr:type II toxin-antitoxin system RelE/ParE family toxin [Burkholderiales bacterium]
MTRLVFAGRLVDDLARIEAHWVAHEIGDRDTRMAEIIDALQVLMRHPLIGRKVESGRRELVIGRGARGYIALYAYDEYDDVVAVAALRGQREDGFGNAP